MFSFRTHTHAIASNRMRAFKAHKQTQVCARAAHCHCQAPSRTQQRLPQQRLPVTHAACVARRSMPIVLACCCCCCRRAPGGTFKSTEMSIEAHVMRLSRRQCPAACFWRLVRPTTRKKCQFSAEVLACCCCCWGRSPSGTFRSEI